MTKQAKSGDTKLRAEVENLEKLAAHLENLQAVSELGADVEIPAELELLTIKPLMEIVNGPEGTDLKLEAELAELVRRGGGGVSRRRVGSRHGRARRSSRRST